MKRLLFVLALLASLAALAYHRTMTVDTAAEPTVGNVVKYGTGAVLADAGYSADDPTFDTVTTTEQAKTTHGIGAIVASKCTAVEYGEGTIHQTVLTFTLTGAHDLDLADGDHGTGIKVYDLPAGRILILGVTIDGSVAHNGAFNASDDDHFYMSLGTAVGADDNALTGTEADLIPAVTLDTAAGATTPLDVNSQLAASAHFDGTGTAVDVYVNVAVEATDNSGATTYALTGTATITWINLGDY